MKNLNWGQIVAWGGVMFSLGSAIGYAFRQGLAQRVIFSVCRSDYNCSYMEMTTGSRHPQTEGSYAYIVQGYRWQR